MTVFSQRNWRWSWKKLGDGVGYSLYYSIGTYGCLLTSLGMVADTRPDTANVLLERWQGFDRHSRVIWSQIPKALPSLTFLERLFTYDNQKALDAIAAHGFVLVEVDAAPIGNPGGRHWVIFLGNQRCADPWSGRIRSTSDFPTVTGLAVLHKN